VAIAVVMGLLVAPAIARASSAASAEHEEMAEEAAPQLR
jgi:hypothetical protein